MPYAQVSLDDFAISLGNLLDDEQEVFWTREEKYYATFESLRYFGALTNYWRARGTVNIPSGPSTPFLDLSTALPALRSRSYTLNDMVKEIQYHLFESAAGISGLGMSGQVSISQILYVIARARNRFVLDARLPFSIHANFLAPPPPDGLAEFSSSCAYVHRASWQDSLSSVWTVLWREDEWGFDRANPDWTLEPSSPQAFSEAVNAPLTLQLSPAPQNTGVLEAITVDSLVIDPANPAQTFNIPDEWIHAVKYAALSDLLSGQGQISDPLRAEYCEQRYQQSIEAAKLARSLIRVQANNIPLPLDSLNQLDNSSPGWRNLSGPPSTSAGLYDLLAINPGIPSTLISLSVDLVRSAPLPTPGTGPSSFLQIGEEDLDTLTDYCVNYLSLKCGGNEFRATLGGYDSFLQTISQRRGSNKVKLRYLSALLGTPQKERSERPEAVSV